LDDVYKLLEAAQKEWKMVKDGKFTT